MDSGTFYNMLSFSFFSLSEKIAVDTVGIKFTIWGCNIFLYSKIEFFTQLGCYQFASEINLFLANEKFDEINTRIELSNQAANPNKRSEQAHVKAGRDGEDFVKSKLEPLGVVRSAVRIPGESHGRREIDLILQTRTHIYLFEVKIRIKITQKN